LEEHAVVDGSTEDADAESLSKELLHNISIENDDHFDHNESIRGDESMEFPRGTFYSEYIEPRMEKGFLSNCFTFIILVVGRLLLIAFPDSILVYTIYQFGLFGFAGGITNWLAIKMLFDRVPGLYGSGVIPNRFVEIRETVKNVIMGTFFDEEYLRKYLTSKASGFLSSMDLESKFNTLLESPEIDAIIDAKLAALATRPEGMLFVMMGINPTSLKPMVKPFVTGMGAEIVPFLTKSFDLGSLLNIGSIRIEIDNLMTTKLAELTPARVKQLLEAVIRSHLGWLVVWGNVFGGLIGVATVLADLIGRAM